MSQNFPEPSIEETRNKENNEYVTTPNYGFSQPNSNHSMPQPHPHPHAHAHQYDITVAGTNTVVFPLQDSNDNYASPVASSHSHTFNLDVPYIIQSIAFPTPANSQFPDRTASTSSMATPVMTATTVDHPASPLFHGFLKDKQRSIHPSPTMLPNIVQQMPSASTPIENGQPTNLYKIPASAVPDYPQYNNINNVPSVLILDSQKDENVNDLNDIALSQTKKANNDLISDILKWYGSSENLTDPEIANSLKQEAIGGLEGWDHVKNLVIKSLGSRIVYLLYEEDIFLFDEIVDYKYQNANSSLENTLEKFCERKKADALCKIIYADPKTHWDAILKYDTKKDIEDDKVFRNKKTRLMFEIALLERNLFLVREKAPDIEKSSEDGKYVKIMAPFSTLSLEAERAQLKKALRVPKSRMVREKLEKKSRYFNMFNRSSTTSPSYYQRDSKPLNMLTGFDNPGFFGSLKTTISFMLAHVSSSASFSDSSTFKLQEMESFMGSENPKHKIQMNFFEHREKNLLTWIVVNRIKIPPFDNTNSFLGYRDLMSENIYTKFYAVHDGSYSAKNAEDSPSNNRSNLFYSWTMRKLTLERLVKLQPIDEIRAYFGEKIAFYFAWLEFYTCWCWMAATVGLAVFVYGLWYGLSKEGTGTQKFFAMVDNAATAPFAFFMSIWSALFLEFWKRQTALLQMRWNVTNMKTNEYQRPEWYGTRIRVSPVTEKKEVFFPFKHKLLLRSWTYFVIFAAIGVLIFLEALLVVYQAWRRGQNVYLSTITSALISLSIIVILIPLYMLLARKLNDLENYKTAHRYEDTLNLKNFILSSVISYSPLVYIAVIKPWVGTSTKIWNPQGENYEDVCGLEPGLGCLSELTVQIIIIFGGLQFLNQAQEVFLPWLFSKISKWMAFGNEKVLVNAKKVSDNSHIPQYIKDDLLPPYAQESDYQTKVIQFGYLTLFTCAFPLAPVLALINNISEIRVDAFKLIAQYQRPFGYRTKTIGLWRDLLSWVSHFAIFVNAVTVAFASQWFTDNVVSQWPPGSDLGVRLGFVLIFEHAVFLIRWIVRFMVPDVPSVVHNKLARDEYFERVENGEVLDEPENEELQVSTMRSRIFGTCCSF